MLYVKVVQNPNSSYDQSNRSRGGPRRSRYQEYSSLQVESDQYEKVKDKGFSLSVKAEAQFSRTNQFKQSYTISSRQGQRPKPQFFHNKQTIDYSNTPLQSTQQQFFMKPQQKKWMDTSINTKRVSRDQIKPDGEAIQSQILTSKQLMEEGDFKSATHILQSLEQETETRFLLAYSLMQMRQFDQTINILEGLLQSNPTYKKECYFYLSVAYAQMKRYDKSNRWLEACLKTYPNYGDAFMQLARNNYNQQDYQNSINYTLKVLKLDNDQCDAHILKADCLIKQKKYSQACDQFTAIERQFPQCKQDFSFRIKQSLAMVKSNKLDAAYNQLNQLIMEHPNHGEALYLRGLVQFKREQLKESLLTFEQVLHTICPRRITAKSIYYIGKIRINQKDFYAAQHNISRFDFYKSPQFPFLSYMKNFIDGAVHLMKRHYREAIDLFKLLLKDQGLSKFLRPIFYLYKSYGHFCLSEYQQVLDDYKNMADMGLQLNQGALYNKEICEALLAAKKYNFDVASDKLNRASLIVPQKMDPYLYKACLIIQRGCQQFNDSQRRACIQEAQQELEKAFNQKGKSANFYYIRALVKSYFHRYSSAIKDLDKAIDLSEDNVVEHFYLRGLLQAQSMRLKQAIKDFSTCVHFNKEHYEGYLERAKCYQITGDQEKAFVDLKKYIQLNSKNPSIHYWAGSLLFHNNAYDESLRAYLECNQTKEVLTLIVKCHLKSQDLDSAYEVLQTMVKQHNDQRVKIDHEMVSILKRMIDSKRSKPKVESTIPQQVSQCQELMDRIATTTKLNPNSFGCLFNIQDFYLHRAIVSFFHKNYTKSLQEFNILEKFWNEKREQRELQSSVSQVVNTEESEQVQNEMILKSERIIQHIISIKYNCILTYLLLNQYKEAFQQCQAIKSLIGDVQSEEINYLQETSWALLENKTVNRFPRVMVFLMNEQSIFHQYPVIKIPLRQGFTLDCKMSISLPDIQPPNICPTFNEKMIELISTNLVENKPEAPWVKRENETLVFTDNIYYGDVDINSEEEELKHKKKKKSDIKQALKLDDNIQNKLNRLLNPPNDVAKTNITH